MNNIKIVGDIFMENKVLEVLQLLQEGQKKIGIRLDSIESQMNENTQLLKALEHKIDVTKVEQESVKHDIAYIKGSFEGVKKDIRNIEVMTVNNWTDIEKLKAIK